jgi:hypothetical protein
MSHGIIILGESGAGKTASLRNLDPTKVLLIQTIRKSLPFRAAGWVYNETGKRKGNIVVSDNSARICRLIRESKREIVIVDDWQYLLANEFMRRVTEKGFEKWNDIGRHAWDVLIAANDADPENKRVYILAHTVTDEFGSTRIKTIGKLLDEKIVPEGMVTVVVRAVIRDGEHVFETVSNGQTPVKCPMGMFNTPTIPNDLKLLDDAIVDFYHAATA